MKKVRVLWSGEECVNFVCESYDRSDNRIYLHNVSRVDDKPFYFDIYIVNFDKVDSYAVKNIE